MRVPRLQQDLFMRANIDKNLILDPYNIIWSHTILVCIPIMKLHGYFNDIIIKDKEPTKSCKRSPGVRLHWENRVQTNYPPPRLLNIKDSLF